MLYWPAAGLIYMRVKYPLSVTIDTGAHICPLRSPQFAVVDQGDSRGGTPSATWRKPA